MAPSAHGDASADDGLSAELPVAAIMRRWPATVDVFVSFRMACPGCPMAPFMTVRDAANAYDIPTDELMDALARRIGAPG